jgi:hypothetical protein
MSVDERGKLSSGPPVFNRETCAKIIKLVREGMPVHLAADLARVMRGDVRAWLKAGRQVPDGAFGRFALDIAEAQAAKTRTLYAKAMALASKDDCSALLKILAIRDPEHFSPRQKIEIDLEGAKRRMLDAAARVLTDEDLAKLCDELERDGEGVATEQG